MAELSGENGAVYFNEELVDTGTSGTIYFSTGKTITSSGAVLNFEDEGYVAGMLVTVSGCTGESANNKIFTITEVSAGVLTVSETVVDSSPEPSEVGFAEAEPGIQVLGFYNWTSSYVGDALETTDFDSSGYREYIAGLTGWTTTAEKYFQIANNEVDDWVGQTCELRLFINYVAIPSTGTPSQYWKGDTVVTGLDNTTPVDALVTQSISFQGDGALTLKTQTKAWNLGIST